MQVEQLHVGGTAIRSCDSYVLPKELWDPIRKTREDLSFSSQGRATFKLEFYFLNFRSDYSHTASFKMY